MTNVPSGGDQNVGEWFERADHPLLNDLVLGMVFDDMRGNDFKICRLVNKKWNICTLPLFRSHHIVTVRGTSSQYSDRFDPRGIRSLMKLMRSNTLGIPFERFKLGSFDTTQGFGQEFVQLVGNTTKKLILDVTGEVYKVQSISDLLLGMPKLECVTMPTHVSSNGGAAVQLFPGAKVKLSFLKSLGGDVGKVQKRLMQEVSPTLYAELLEAAPNISTLNLWTSSYPIANDAGIEILEALEKLGRGSSIQNLRLPAMNPSILTLLLRMATKGMELKKLDFRVRISVQNIIDWLQIVTIFKDSLISLNIRYESSESMPRVYNIVFPTMPKLIKLKLMLMTMNPENINLSCENFTTTFPGLEELHIYVELNQLNYFITGNSISTIKTFILHHKQIDIKMFNRILSVFPALTSLDCEVTEDDGAEIIRKIWSQMTQLQGLRICGTLGSSENVDSLVTGISVQKLNKIPPNILTRTLNQAKTQIQRGNILKRMMMNKHKLASIGNLSNLKSLSLDVWVRGSDIYKYNSLTDLTAYFALYSVKSLNHLSVSNCEFSMECCDILVKDLGLMTWSFGYLLGGNSNEIIPSGVSHSDDL